MGANAMRAKQLTDRDSRQRARSIRDSQWAFMERLVRETTVNVNVWNKYGQEERPDELRLDLISGQELCDWLRTHANWFQIGPQNYERWTNPVSLTDAGRAALVERAKYDMEPVTGGLVEPGWQAIPLPSAPNQPKG